jgi:hypothetical protein
VNPRTITADDLEFWADRNPQPARYTAPGEIDEGIEPCPALNLSEGEIAVPWALDEIELAHLAKGGTLWLVVRGYLPVHGLFVEPR